MRAMLCHCRTHLEARDDRALAEKVREHILREHAALSPSDEQVWEIVRTRAYDLQYAMVTPDEELIYDPS